ncbi:hypothetical protein CATRI_13035 [Corynebacterium atrinae]|uniref:hypothetical protein n=1 Tax=Corynebacterium atrinae TaxID=1336740 RepID=UPI0025B324A9|nr:hypothetical protein [Corynebacterium atrinae]WJY64652.1 hypothetical protein CATRI_13035 [Corynebacterium atrinae]
MIALNLRVRRVFILVWSVCLWVFLSTFPPAYESYYPTLESRAAFATGMQSNLGMVAIYGPLHSPVSLGQIVMWEAGSQILLLGSIMSVLLVIGLARRSEHLGFTELELSTGIRRRAPLVAAMGTTCVASAFVGFGAFLVLGASSLYIDELPVVGALAFGVNLTLTMCGSALLALAVLLLVNSPASLTRVGLLSVAASFVLRSLADSEEIGWLNWLSPLGWKQVIAPYGDNSFTNAVLLAILCLALAGGLYLAEGHREYGRGLVQLRERTSKRSRKTRSIVHLQWLLHRGSAITWALVIAGITAMFLALTGSLSEWMSGDPAVGKVFEDLFNEGDLKTEFIRYIAKLSGILVAVAGVQSIIGQYSAERDGTAELMRSTGIRRWAPLGSLALIGLASVLLSTIALYSGGAAGLASQHNTSASDYEALLPSALSQFAPALLLVAFAVLIVGHTPRFSYFSWVPVAIASILTLFGPLFKLPMWLIDLSPFEHEVTALGDSWSMHFTFALVSLLLIVLGLWGANRRELV